MRSLVLVLMFPLLGIADEPVAEAPLRAGVYCIENVANGGSITAVDNVDPKRRTGNINLQGGASKTSQHWVVRPIDGAQFISKGAVVTLESRKFSLYMSPLPWDRPEHLWHEPFPPLPIPPTKLKQWMAKAKRPPLYVGYETVTWPTAYPFKLTQVEGSFLKIQVADGTAEKYPPHVLESAPDRPEQIRFWCARTHGEKMINEQLWIFKSVE